MTCFQKLVNGNTTSPQWTSLFSRATNTLLSPCFALASRMKKRRLKSQREWSRSSLRMALYAPSLSIGLFLMLSPISLPAQADTGIATWYSIQSTRMEGNTGITASGERLDENSLSCAVRSRKFGTLYKVTNLKTGKSLVCKHNDFGPGKKPAKRGVIIDLTPKAFDSLGGKRGATWGEFPVRVTKVSRATVQP